MTTSISPGLLNQLLGSGGFKETMDGSEFRLYAGLVPAAAGDSIGAATLLCTVKNGASGVTFDDTTPGVLLKPAAETWSGTNVATGTATFFRHAAAADDGGASTTAPRLQGTTGVSGADLNISDTNLVAATPQALDYYNLTLPTF